MFPIVFPQQLSLATVDNPTVSICGIKVGLNKGLAINPKCIYSLRVRRCELERCTPSLNLNQLNLFEHGIIGKNDH